MPPSSTKQLADLVLTAMPRFPWCHGCQVGFPSDNPFAVLVTWRDADGGDNEFTVTVGEAERVAEAPRKFVAMLGEKAGMRFTVEATKEVRREVLKAIPTTFQYVMACEKCDRLVPDGMAPGSDCPNCGEKGGIHRWKVTQPKYPGVVPGMKELADNEQPRTPPRFPGSE